MSQMPTKKQKAQSKAVQDKLDATLSSLSAGIKGIADKEEYIFDPIPDLLKDIVLKNQALKRAPQKKTLPVPSIKELTKTIFAKNGTFVHVKSKLGKTKPTKLY